MAQFKLSICIPTYNRALFVKELLDSIESQWMDSVQVVVSDNASSDNTMDIVNSFKQKNMNIELFVMPTNVGAEKNFLNVVSLAKGEYVWLIGSDDVLVHGALRLVMDRIADSTADILLFDRYDCDMSLNILRRNKWFSIPSFTMSSRERKEFLLKMKYARSIGAVFSFISSNVFKKDIWNEFPNPEEYLGTFYVHVPPLLSAVERGITYSYSNEAVIYCRCAQDSFFTGSRLDRILLDYLGYLSIIEGLRIKEDFSEVLRLILLKEGSLVRIFNAIGCDWGRGYKKFISVYEKLQHSRTKRLAVKIGFLMAPLLGVLVKIRRLLVVIKRDLFRYMGRFVGKK